MRQRVIFLQYSYMRLLAWVFSSVLLCCSVSGWGTPIYRAGENVSSARSIWHGEVSGGYGFSSHQLKENRDGNKSSRLHETDVRALWAPLSWLAVGVEMDWFDDGKMAPAVKKYKVNQTAGIIKLTLAPNTTPRFYIVAGVGKSKNKITYDRSLKQFNRLPVEKEIPFWKIGLGLEVDVWKIVFIGTEGTLTRYNKTKMTEIYELSSKTETALHIRAGVRF